MNYLHKRPWPRPIEDVVREQSHIKEDSLHAHERPHSIERPGRPSQQGLSKAELEEREYHRTAYYTPETIRRARNYNLAHDLLMKGEHAQQVANTPTRMLPVVADEPEWMKAFHTDELPKEMYVRRNALARKIVPPLLTLPAHRRKENETIPAQLPEPSNTPVPAQLEAEQKARAKADVSKRLHRLGLDK
jgi:hypothetical protein